MSEIDDIRSELLGVVRQTRALVQTLVDSGAEVLAREPVPPADPRVEAAAARDAAQAPTPAGSASGTGADAPGSPAAPAARPAPPTPVRMPAAPPADPAAAEAPAPEALSPAERDAALSRLAEQVRNCTRCRLSESRTHAAFARGSADAEMVFVGEGPGAEEDAQGLPFVGKAGKLLDRMVAAMGYERDAVYICNVVKCRPPKNRKPEPDEVAACAPYLREQLGLLSPKVIVSLGATGVQGLLGVSGGITRLRGTWRLYRGRVPLMPTFHPAYLLRRPEKKREVWEDLKQVMGRLGKSVPEGGAGGGSGQR